MKGVPGVMAFESTTSLLAPRGGNFVPCDSSFARSFSSALARSSASWAALQNKAPQQRRHAIERGCEPIGTSKMLQTISATTRASERKPRQRARPVHAPKAPRTLLVHLRAGSHPVDGHVQELPRPHDEHEAVDVLENVLEDLHLRSQ